MDRASTHAPEPWLSTARLDLSRPTAADVDAVYAIHSDRRTYQHAVAGRMETRQQAINLLGASNEHWATRGFGYASVRLRGLPGIVGFAGVKHQVVRGAEVLNLYYRFAPAAWGSGYASEAAAALVTWAAAEHPDTPVIARTARNNPRSQRVAERIGLLRQDVADDRDPVPHWIYSSARLP